MLLIWDSGSEHVAHVRIKICLFRKWMEFDDSFDVTKCLQQIEIPGLLYNCATCFELTYITNKGKIAFFSIKIVVV